MQLQSLFRVAPLNETLDMELLKLVMNRFMFNVLWINRTKHNTQPLWKQKQNFRFSIMTETSFLRQLTGYKIYLVFIPLFIYLIILENLSFLQSLFKISTENFLLFN